MKPRIVIVMDGGIIQNIIADSEVEVVCVDYDAEGAEPEDVTDLPNRADDGSLSGGSEDAVVWESNVNIEPAFVAARFEDASDSVEASETYMAEMRAEMEQRP